MTVSDWPCCADRGSMSISSGRLACSQVAHCFCLRCGRRLADRCEIPAFSVQSSVAATSLSDIVCGFQLPPDPAETASDPAGTRRCARSVRSVEAIGLNQPETQSPHYCPLERGGDCAFRLGRAVRSGSSLAVGRARSVTGQSPLPEKPLPQKTANRQRPIALPPKQVSERTKKTLREVAFVPARLFLRI
jgi:hypothetical protein